MVMLAGMPLAKINTDRMIGEVQSITVKRSDDIFNSGGAWRTHKCMRIGLRPVLGSARRGVFDCFRLIIKRHRRCRRWQRHHWGERTCGHSLGRCKGIKDTPKMFPDDK